MTSTHIRKLRRGLVVLAIALPMLYALFAGIAIVQDYRSTIRQAESDVRNISAALNEHAMRTFGEADTRLRDAIADMERRGLTLTRADEREIHDILIAQMQGLPQAATMSVLDPGGWMRATATTYPLQPINSSDREYYNYLSSHRYLEMYVSRSVKARATDKWVIPITRRVENLDGKLKMIVGFGVDMAYFDGFYRTLQLGNYGRLLLVRRDGRVVMESPLTEGVLDKNLAGTALFRHIEHTPTGVYQTERSAVDDTARIVGYWGMPQFPVIAVASVSRDYVLEPWLTRALQTGAIGVISTLMLLALLRFLWFRLADLGRAQTDLAQQNNELIASRQRFEELVDGIDGIVWEAELPDFRFTYVSGNAEAISGYAAHQWINNPHFYHDKLAMGPDDKPVEPVLATNGPGLLKPIEHRIQAPNGSEIWLRSNVMVAGAGHGRLQVRGVTVDITRQKQSELQLFQAIHVDPLTKLPNRRAMVERTDHALAIAAHNQTAVAVVLIDVDNFNTLNDSLGHERGDELLRQLADKLQGCLGSMDALGRIGGDEFVVLMEEVDRSAVRVEHLAERIRAVLGNPIVVDSRDLYVTVSMGIALFPQDGQDYQALMRSADTALYRAKAAGRNGWQLFNGSMARHLEHRLDIETALRRALERNEFHLQFQPQRSLRSGRIVGAEALVRWERPGVGMVPPKDFIPVAEETGLIVALGAWVLRAACIQAAAWRELGFDLRIAVNVADIQLQQGDFVDQVRRALEESGLPPHYLELEITEGSLVKDMLCAVEKLHQVKGLGVELAVDDFGTGYSSLSYLKQLPFDRLKIDQSFVRDIPSDANDCAIVRAIIAMARNLKLGVIAEGVESDEQLEFLRSEGCDEIQGFCLSPPISADALAARFPAAATRIPDSAPLRTGVRLSSG